MHKIPKFSIAKHTICALLYVWLCAFVLVCITRVPFLSQVMVGEDDTSIIYECSMTHNCHQCATLYLEDEYEN